MGDEEPKYRRRLLLAALCILLVTGGISIWWKFGRGQDDGENGRSISAEERQQGGPGHVGDEVEEAPVVPILGSEVRSSVRVVRVRKADLPQGIPMPVGTVPTLAGVLTASQLDELLKRLEEKAGVLGTGETGVFGIEETKEVGGGVHARISGESRGGVLQVYLDRRGKAAMTTSLMMYDGDTAVFSDPIAGREDEWDLMLLTLERLPPDLDKLP